MSNISRLAELERQLERCFKESIATPAVPMDMNIDPDTFSGPAIQKAPSACKCDGDGDCKCNSGPQESDCDGCDQGECEGSCESYERMPGCVCEGNAPCMCDASLEENKFPVKHYVFTREVENQSDRLLPLGYTFTKFLSLLQKLVAPLRVHNAPGSISVVASPALERGLRNLAKKEKMEMDIAKVKKEGRY